MKENTCYCRPHGHNLPEDIREKDVQLSRSEYKSICSTSWNPGQRKNWTHCCESNYVLKQLKNTQNLLEQQMHVGKKMSNCGWTQQVPSIVLTIHLVIQVLISRQLKLSFTQPQSKLCWDSREDWSNVRCKITIHKKFCWK